MVSRRHDDGPQKSLQSTARRLLSTLTTYSPDADQDTALMGDLSGEEEVLVAETLRDTSWRHFRTTRPFYFS